MDNLILHSISVAYLICLCIILALTVIQFPWADILNAEYDEEFEEELFLDAADDTDGDDPEDCYSEVSA